MKILLLALTMFIFGGCSQIMDTSRVELSLEAIQRADEMGRRGRELVEFGLIDAPEQEWIDKISAYYIALNSAWAYGDEDSVDYFFGKMEDLYLELVEDQLEEYPIVPEQYNPGQEL